MTSPRQERVHATRLFGLRFVARESELAYREWHGRVGTVFARIGYVGSTPSWALMLGAVLVLDHRAAKEAALWVGAWILLLLVLTALTFRAELQRTVMPLAAAANCLAGFLIVWLLSDVVLVDKPAPARSGVMTAGLIVVMFFGFAIHRIPPGLAITAVTPYLAFGCYQLYDSAVTEGLGTVEAAALGAAQCIAYLGCLLVCLVTEGVDRRAFRQEQVIAAQQRELRASREAIRRYVPRAVSEHIVNGHVSAVDVPTRREVTVLLADLVAFTALAESVDAELLTRVTNDYMTAVSELVDEHGGIVCEFAGDGLMALFGAPDAMDLSAQAVSAVRTALAMQARMPALSRSWQEAGAPSPMQMRIGISTGVLSVGSFGSAGRMTYTAIGSHTNIASRLEAQCEPGGVLVSASTWRLATDLMPFEARGSLACKGVREPVDVYSPVPLPRQHPSSAAGLATRET